MALALKRMGIMRVRPLAGGLDTWANRGLPLEPMTHGVIGQDVVRQPAP